MSIIHRIAATALMFFLIQGDICTSNHICSSYASLENFINEITKSDREHYSNMVSGVFHSNYENYAYWSSVLQSVLKNCCDELGQKINVFNALYIGLPRNWASNEICNGSAVSTYLNSEIGAFQGFYPKETWNLTEDCSNATKLLREDCFAMERNTTDMSIGFDEGPKNVASRMGKAMEKCMFRRNFCEGNPCSETSKRWKLYVLILEFLERIHPGVEYGQDGYTSIKT